ncbi:efflux transporter outer membrane subunit [Massilia sp. S19_KUP03_FR1]|uniref:efflux transporter outer membrane subunit n=1 Tax=Massilia sp. S19_KUP03_FR1 TaxID=3025503 RepID=UPI002FCDD8E5
MKHTILTMAVMSLLTGCSLAPVYERPAATVAPAFPTGAAYQGVPVAAADATPVAQIAWRDYFADAALRQLIALALANNRDLRVSSLNIEAARAQYDIDRAALLPSLSANLSETASRTPGSVTGNQATVSHTYSGGLALASYELDFFGKLRNLSEAGLQTYLGTEDARRAQQIALVSQVAIAYATLSADQQRLKLAAETVASQQTSFDLSTKRLAAGATSGVDVYNAQTSVATAKSDLAVYTAQVAIDVNALTLLVGSALPEGLIPQGEFENVTTMAAIPAGLPSSLLEARPDILQAERLLRAANANIGVARAAFFPSISLTASGGSQSSSLSGLFKGGSGAWSFAPSINLPIFDGGVNRANLAIAKVDDQIAVAQYEKAIQTAFGEVSDALATRGTIDARMNAQLALVEAATKSYRIYEARYKLGADTYLNALIAQRTLYAAQQGMITTRLARSSNAVTLYKVLGGGWQPERVRQGG